LRAIKKLLIFVRVVATMHVITTPAKILRHRRQMRSKVKLTQTAYKQFLPISCFPSVPKKDTHSPLLCDRCRV